MLEALLNPVWLGVILALVGVVVTIAVPMYLSGRNRKIVTWGWTSTTSLVLVNKEASGVQILYNGSPVKSLARVALTVSNTGQIAVKPGVPKYGGDYEEPLTFDFGPNAKVVSARLEGQHAAGQAGLVIDDNHCVVFPLLLLNPTERVSVVVEVDGWDNSLSASAKIVDVASIQRKDAEPPDYLNLSDFHWILIFIVSAILGAFVSVGLLGVLGVDLNSVGGWGSPVAIGAAVGFIYGGGGIWLVLSQVTSDSIKTYFDKFLS